MTQQKLVLPCTDDIIYPDNEMSAAKEPSSENTKNPTILDVLLTSTLGVKVGEKGASLQLMRILEEANYLDQG